MCARACACGLACICVCAHVCVHICVRVQAWWVCGVCMFVGVRARVGVHACMREKWRGDGEGEGAAESDQLAGRVWACQVCFLSTEHLKCMQSRSLVRFLHAKLWRYFPCTCNKVVTFFDFFVADLRL